MKEVLSFSEIEQEFNKEWVLISDPEADEQFNIKSGIVLWHSKDRDELYRKAKDLNPVHSAIIYVGELPDNAVIVL